MRIRLIYLMTLALLPAGVGGQAQEKGPSPSQSVPTSHPGGPAPLRGYPNMGGPASPVFIESIQAVSVGAETRVTVQLRGRAEPRLSVQDRTVTVRLGSARPGLNLATRMTSGGLVKRVGFQTGSRTGETLTEEAQISLELNSPAEASIAAGTDPQLVTVRLVPRGAVVASPITRTDESRLFDIAAYQTDVSLLLRSLAQEANCNILLSDKVTNKVTINLHQVELAKAIELITSSAGLTVRHEGDTYLVGVKEEPKGGPVVTPVGTVQPGDPTVKKAEPVIGVYEVIHCHYILASDLAATLGKMFPAEELKVTVGASNFAPRLEASVSTSTVTGVDASAGKSQGGAEAGSNSHDVVMYGAPEVVARAVALAKRLDARRAQLRIGVTITDVSTDAMRDLGLQWAWSSFSVKEVAGSGAGINFGKFARDPISVSATLSALEKDNRAKLLASPTLSMLDGERSFMLIGDRLIYPKLIGYTQAQTPIFDKEEARVGIYLQVAAQTVSDNEILLTLYPQVSVVTGYLTVNGASYPQISTREQQTTIRVKHGEKIVVGGLMRDEEIQNIQRVPILSKIPLFGELFTWRSKTHHKSEVIVIITPEILKD